MRDKEFVNTYVILRRNVWPSHREFQTDATRSGEAIAVMSADIKWIRSYVLAEENGTLGTLCVYQATSEDKLREHAACVGIPVHEIVLVADVVLVSPDPEEPHTPS